MAFHADAYCSYFLLDVEDATRLAEKAVAGFSRGEKIEDLAIALTGLGNCKLALCRLEEAREAYLLAVTYSMRMGDDCRTSLIYSNLGTSYLLGGEIDKAIQYGEDSLRIGRRAPAQPALLRTWSNLAFSYILGNKHDKARECLESMHRWMQEGRSWAINIEYYCECACIELALGNTVEALRLSGFAQQHSQGREFFFPNQGALERLMVFLTYHTKGAETAYQLAKDSLERFRNRHPLAQLDAVAAMAWTEMRINGRYSGATEGQLSLFETYRAFGKRALLVAQGFLR
jgi:tetratricopeptide (TPR) repeat protein